jgi:diacylglycerol kinase
MEIIKKHHISFKCAFEGFIWAVKTQPNFRIHIVLTIFALVFGFYLNISPMEWALIVITIVFGLAMEMANTAIEEVTDMITTSWTKEAKIAKDVAAGMMLITAIGAVIVAGIIFLPKIWLIYF